MTNIYQLKIVLDRTSPPIWRRFLIEEGLSFHKLHLIIQEVMGWETYHLYQFIVNENIISIPNDDWDEPEKIVDSKKKKVNGLSPKQKFSYIYDFGDYWEHTIILEKVLPKDLGVIYPKCIEGKFACPPEDCGSCGGYYHLLSVKKDKKHPEYKSLIKEWLGEEYDPDKLDIDNINKRLLVFRKIDGRARYWTKNK